MTSITINEQLQNEYEREIIVMLIGGRLQDIKKRIINHLAEGMFINKLYRTFYTVIDEMYKKGEELTIDNVCLNVQKEDVKALTIELGKECITTANCNYYLTKLLDSYIARLIKNAKTMEDFEKIKAAKTRYSIQNNLKSISHGAENLMVNYYERWETMMTTGYPAIDDKIGSLQGGDLMILAGATGMGKTCYMLNMIERIAQKGKKVCLFSLEMTLEQLQNRVICAKLGINANDIRSFKMSGEDQTRYDNYACSQEFKSMQILVSSSFDLGIDQMKNEIYQSDADIIFIDYLGLIKGDSKKNSYERISDISRQLKLLALELNKPFIVLHQLSRAASDRQDKRPQISDLRDSGKIEQDADFICFVYRPAYYLKTADKHNLQFMIAKSRHGQGRTHVDLVYNEKTQKIIDPSEVQKNEEEETKQWSLGF